MAPNNDMRGSIAFFTTYRPAVPLGIFSCPLPRSENDQINISQEVHITDGRSSNYNGRVIPKPALNSIIENIIKRPNLKSRGTISNVDSGLIFVSERDNGLETLHIALRFKDTADVEVFSFADVYDMPKNVRLEDSACFAGDFVVYVSTKENPDERRQPWTVVYKTNLKTGDTDRLTPSWHADLRAAASPNGRMIAVASFQRRGGWHGEIEDLQTDIYVMNLEKPFNRRLVVKNGGWPTWGCNRFIFFHRMVVDEVDSNGKIKKKHWAVFRANIDNKDDIALVTSRNIDAMTPAAISDTKVAVAVVNLEVESDKDSKELDSMDDDDRKEEHYRQIQIFDVNRPKQPIKVTQNTRPKADHYNPFVIDDGKRIGYHRCNAKEEEDDEEDDDDEEEKPAPFHGVKSPDPEIELFRVSGVFPTFSPDGSKLAFVDNELKTVWVVEKGKDKKPYDVYQDSGDNVVFSPVWNQNIKKNILYICMGKSFMPEEKVHICKLDLSTQKRPKPITLTKTYYPRKGGPPRSPIDDSNNAFPSSNPEGTKLVFRSTRHGGKHKYKHLYIMDDAENGENQGPEARQLTFGNSHHTHCQWAPKGDWIVFSSTRDKPDGAPEKDNDLDPGYYGVYLVKASDDKVVVRVLASGYDIAGHVNHPAFSRDGKSIAVASDLAAVSADPISLPIFLHSVRPYGDIFSVDIDDENIKNNKDLKFNRITHSKFENSTPAWTMFSIKDPNDTWNLPKEQPYSPTPCPAGYSPNPEGWSRTGHLCIRVKGRCC